MSDLRAVLLTYLSAMLTEALSCLILVGVLIFQMHAGGLISAHADEAREPVYPGRYVATCKPAPIVGCTCETDSISRVSTETGDRIYYNQDVEYRRAVEWLRLTCAAVTQSRNLR